MTFRSLPSLLMILKAAEILLALKIFVFTLELNLVLVLKSMLFYFSCFRENFMLDQSLN